MAWAVLPAPDSSPHRPAERAARSVRTPGRRQEAAEAIEATDPVRTDPRARSSGLQPQRRLLPRRRDVSSADASVVIAHPPLASSAAGQVDASKQCGDRYHQPRRPVPSKGNVAAGVMSRDETADVLHTTWTTAE